MKKLTLSVLMTIQCVAQAASIDGLTHGLTDKGKYEIVFKGSAHKPQSFVTSTPNTLVLDFQGTNSGLSKKTFDILMNGIYGVDILESGDRTRAVVNLAAPINYEIVQRGQDIVVQFDPVKRVQLSTPLTVRNGNITTRPNQIRTAGSIRPSLQSATQVQHSNAVEPSLSTRFGKKNAQTAALAFTLPPSVRNVRTRQNGQQIIASIDGFYASKADQRRMEVASYGTVVDTVDVFRTAKGTDIVLNIKRSEPFEFASFQNGDIYTVEVKKPVQDRSLQKEIDELQGFSSSKRYRGAPMSLNFQDIEVRAVLQIIAEFTKNNIVVSDAVNGNITLRLDNVPWDQALDIILKTKGLGMRENGSVIYIAPASELDQRELDALKLIRDRDLLIPARTELIQVKYAKAAELATILERSRDSGSGQGQSVGSQDSILSSKGTVSVDNRTNTLLVSDIPSKLQAVRDLVARLDEPVRQVLIDARIVLTQDRFARELGSKFGISFFNTGNSVLTSGSGKLEGASGLNSALVESASKDGDAALSMPGLSDRLGVNLPASAENAPSYGLAILGADFLVDLELSALQTEGKLEIVSSPRVVTQDGKKAKISKGQEKKYTTLTDKGPVTEFKEAVLAVDVIPRIAPDDRVDMELIVSKDDFADDTTKNVNNVTTNVLVDNGETIVLGGVYEQTQSLRTDKVPLLGDLPIVGNAFKTTSKSFNKDELLIFVTPRIIDNQLSDHDKFSNLRN